METRNCAVVVLFMALSLLWTSECHDVPLAYGNSPYFREELDRMRHLNEHLLDELKDLRHLHANLQFHLDALDLRYGSRSRSLREDPLPSLTEERGGSSFSVDPPRFSSQIQPGFTLSGLNST